MEAGQHMHKPDREGGRYAGANSYWQLSISPLLTRGLAHAGQRPCGKYTFLNFDLKASKLLKLPRLLRREQQRRIFSLDLCTVFQRNAAVRPVST
jgi:hypothetical protein